MSFFPQRIHAVLHSPEGNIFRGRRRIAVRETAFHGKGIPDSDDILGGEYLHITIGLTHILFAGLPLGKIAADRITQKEFPPLIEHHHCRIERNFGHRRQTEEGVPRHRRFGIPVSNTKISLVKRGSSLHDFEGTARQSFFDKTFQKSVNVFYCCHICTS